jgi:hypothetical protein
VLHMVFQYGRPGSRREHHCHIQTPTVLHQQ